METMPARCHWRSRIFLNLPVATYLPNDHFPFNTYENNITELQIALHTSKLEIVFVLSTSSINIK